MKRWTGLVLSLALVGSLVRGAAPTLRGPETLEPRQGLQSGKTAQKLGFTRFWCDLPAPPEAAKPTADAAATACKPATRLEKRSAATARARGTPGKLAKSRAKAGPAQESAPAPPLALLPELRQWLADRKQQAPPPLAVPAPPAPPVSRPAIDMVSEPGPDLADRHGPPRGLPPALTEREIPPVVAPPAFLPWPKAASLRVAPGHKLPVDQPALTGGILAPANASAKAPPAVTARPVRPCSWLDDGYLQPASKEARLPDPIQAGRTPPSPLPECLPAAESKAPLPRPAPVVRDLPPMETAGEPLPTVIHGKNGAPRQAAPLRKETLPRGAVWLAQAGLPLPPASEGPPLEAASEEALRDGPASSSAGFLFLADFLHWRPRTAPFPYAGVAAPIPGTTAANSFAIDAVDTGLDWNSGYRFGAGYRGAGGWQAAFVYTHLDSQGGTALGNPGIDGNAVYAALLNRSLLPGTGLVDFASEQRQFRYDVYDLEVGRAFAPLAGLDLTGFAGFRAASIADDSRVGYLDNSFQLSLGRALEMNAWGGRGGLNGRYALGSTGLAILADGSFSLLYAEFDSSRIDALTGGITGIQAYQATVNGVAPVVDLRLALGYTYGPLLVALGYEFSYWFNYYQHADAPGSALFLPSYRLERGSLSLDGWFVRAGFRY